MLEFDPATIEQHAGMAIGGMLGFDMLHTMVLHLDYRDGLVKMESAAPEVEAVGGATQVAQGGGSPNEGQASCDREAMDVPAAATIEAAAQECGTRAT